MTKSDLIESVYARLRIPKKDSQEIVELLLQTLKAALARGETVKVSGFGTFHSRVKGRRVCRNPRTGARLEIAARRVLSFRPGEKMKHALNPAHGRSRPRRHNGAHREAP